MQFTAALTSTLALVVLASASVVPRTDGSQCNTGPVQCCNSLQDASDVSNLSGLLGVAAPITGLIGMNCTPLSVVNAFGGNKCSTQAVCCSGNTSNGLVVVGCSPVSL
ncbi:fungal hydrophobin [Pluteus cervinus]|uniref:Fungal hydrophobin n=1 Tax=Pluteus cervinus TaxID=181527 RepID=A0ACD3ARL0_9AGAR|nr:fungal hydrophobin [Pluteus cervinus]